jgi:hypothetical protein
MHHATFTVLLPGLFLRIYLEKENESRDNVYQTGMLYREAVDIVCQPKMSATVDIGHNAGSHARHVLEREWNRRFGCVTRAK